MIIENYNEGVRALIAQVQEKRREGDPSIMEPLETLLRIGKRMEDNALIGYAYHYLADAYFSHPYPYDRFLENLTEGLRYQMLAGETELIARSYNLISIDAVYHGSHDLSIDALITAREYSEHLTHSLLPGILSYNIGSAYHRIGDVNKAIYYWMESKRLTVTFKNDTMYFRNMSAILSSLGIQYMRLGREEDAKECLQQLLAIKADADAPEYIFKEAPIQIFQAVMLHAAGEMDAYRALVNEIYEGLSNMDDLADFAEEVFFLCEQLIASNDTKELDRCLEKIFSLTKGQDDDYINFHIQLQDFLIRYYKKKRDEPARKEALAQFHHYHVLHDKDRATSCVFSVEMAHMMDKHRQELLHSLDEDLKQRHTAQTDALTGLPGSIFMLDKIEDGIDRAALSHVNLGVSILRYPPELAADHALLKETAHALTTLNTPKVVCTKGEANEFIILYEDMTNQDIMQYAQLITDRVRMFLARFTPAEPTGLRRFFQKKKEAFVLPHGVCTGIPTVESSPWEYLSTALLALNESLKSVPVTIVRKGL